MARHSRIVRGARRKTTWFDIPPVAATMTSEGGTTLLVLTATEAAKRPFTIIRTHLELMIQSDQSAATEVQVAAVGMCVVSDQARAVGISAVPTPITDSGSDLFFVHQFLFSNFNFLTAAGFSEGRAAAQYYSVDSKAMRKVNDDEDVLVVAEMDTIGGGVVLHAAGRMLIKEH